MSTPSDFPVMTFASAARWETWLQQNHAASPGVWIRMLKKGSGVGSVDHAGAVEVALCFGWIDGQARPLDDQSWLQKFTPRRSRSIWSKKNTEHAVRLISEGRMRPAGLKEVERAKEDGRWQRAYDSPAASTVPEDFLQELEKSPEAKAFFATLNKTNTYAIYHRIHTAKKPETRERRIRQFVEMLEKGERLYP
jgi:uncharacterized protein YdeI (YjbR/CyaY-like superfamily)